MVVGTLVVRLGITQIGFKIREKSLIVFLSHLISMAMRDLDLLEHYI
jgi:hypothetical protein